MKPLRIPLLIEDLKMKTIPDSRTDRHGPKMTTTANPHTDRINNAYNDQRRIDRSHDE
jgi:hypothetical protein